MERPLLLWNGIFLIKDYSPIHMHSAFCLDWAALWNAFRQDQSMYIWFDISVLKEAISHFYMWGYQAIKHKFVQHWFRDPFPTHLHSVMSVLYIQAAYGAAAAGSCLLYGGALSYHMIHNRESKLIGPSAKQSISDLGQLRYIAMQCFLGNHDTFYELWTRDYPRAFSLFSLVRAYLYLIYMFAYQQLNI